GLVLRSSAIPRKAWSCLAGSEAPSSSSTSTASSSRLSMCGGTSNTTRPTVDSKVFRSTNSSISRGAGLLGQRGVEQREHAAPGFLGLIVVVDRRIRRTPAVLSAGVDLDFRRQVGLREGLLESR